MESFYVTYRDESGKITVAEVAEAWFQDAGKLVVFKPVDGGRLEVTNASAMITMTAADPATVGQR
jgi:hypothetical protein